jgi:hypothetical protein
MSLGSVCRNLKIVGQAAIFGPSGYQAAHLNPATHPQVGNVV